MVRYDKLLNQDFGVPALYSRFEIVEDNSRFLIGPVVEYMFEAIRSRTMDGLLLCEEVIAHLLYIHNIHISRCVYFIKEGWQFLQYKRPGSIRKPFPEMNETMSTSTTNTNQQKLLRIQARIIQDSFLHGEQQVTPDGVVCALVFHVLVEAR